MIKKIECRVIKSAAVCNNNNSNDKKNKEDNLFVHKLFEPFSRKTTAYTNRSGTVRINYDNSPIGKFLDFSF